VRGSKVERRVERTIALMLVLSGLLALGSVAALIWWPFPYRPEVQESVWYTPLVGLGLGGSLLLLGFAVITWAKKLLPEEISVQDRHDGASPRDEQSLTGATILNLLDETGIKRRPMLKAALLVPAVGLGAVAIATPVAALIRNPRNNGQSILYTTGFDPQFNDGKPVRLVRDDGTPIRPEEVSVGGQMTVFPGIPGGSSNKWADSVTLLIHLREDSALAAAAAASALNEGSQWENFVAYSKICTHAGCPASLFEQQTNRLLCPCHQSQFLITENGRPIFGPATRPLPQLPITVDEEGYFVAKSDYKEPVGPAFWERTS
jgi:ubiquinol-cytochrome c reductase iron-sulfur subunit